MEPIEYRIKELFNKYVQGTLTEEELNEFLQFFWADEYEDTFKELLQSNFDGVTPTGIMQGRIDRITRGVDNTVFNRVRSEKKKIPMYRWLGGAAAAIVLIIGSYLFFNNSEEQPSLVADIFEDVDPGANRATLTFADGSVYNLSEQQSEITTDEMGIRYSNGERIAEESEPTIVTLSTPRGGQYRITLPDGTKVFVNSASVIKYPTQFTDRIREVEVQGEAYFEVAPDHSRPFVVHSSNQHIKVLGTKFNLNSYANEPAATTLLEGSVQIDFSGGSSPVTLRAGQQTVLKDNMITVNEVNPQDYIGWTQDVFVFSDVPLTEIMKQLERWYDIEVLYPQGFKDANFFAEIPRNRKLSEVLRSLEKAGNYKFEQRERRVTVR